MRILLIIGLVACLFGCADKETRTITLPDTDTDTYCTAIGNTITCPDGSTLTFTPAADEIAFTQTKIKHNSCSPVSNGLFVESIRNSEIFDVYLDSSCKDRVNGQLNEVCDNVEPSFGNSGSLGSNKPGASEVCSFENLLIFGERTNEALIINILEVL